MDRNWNEIDKKYGNKIDSLNIACDEGYERRFIIESVLEVLPHLRRPSVVEAMEYCCSKIPPPRSREQFWKCLLKYLEYEMSNQGS